MSNVSAPFVLFERSGRWASSLRRHGLVERLRLVEARSFSELDELLASHPQAIVGVELNSATIERVVEWLGRQPVPVDLKVIVFAERPLRPYEALCREAGVVHFVASELELFSLAAVIDRYLSQASFAKLDAAEQPLAERIRARMPW